MDLWKERGYHALVPPNTFQLLCDDYLGFGSRTKPGQIYCTRWQRGRHVCKTLYPGLLQVLLFSSLVTLARPSVDHEGKMPSDRDTPIYQSS